MRDRLGRLRFRPSRRLLIVGGAVTTAAVLILVLLSVVVLPVLVRRAAVSKLEAMVTVPVEIGKVNVNLLTGRARASNIVIHGLAGGPSIVALPALDLELSYRGLLRGAVVLHYLAFNEPKVFIERTGPESVNVIQAMRPREGGGAASVTVEQIQIRGGTLAFVDRTQTPAFERTFTGISLTAGQLSTLPQFRLTPTSFELRVGIGQGALVVTGATNPFGQPAGVELTARMEKLDPGVLKGYLPLAARMDFRGSSVDGEVRYRLAYQGDRATENRLAAHVETGPIRFLPLDDDTPLVTVGGVMGQNIRADFLANRVELGDVVLRQPSVKLERGPGGTFNVAKLIKTEETAAPPPAPQAAETGASETRQAAAPAADRQPVSVTLGRLVLEGGTIDYADPTVTPAVHTVLQDVRLVLQDVGLGGAPRPGRLEGEARLERGQVRLAGTVQGAPVAGRVRLTASGIPIQPFRGYADAALRSTSARGGTLDARLDALASPGTDGRPRLELTGSIGGRDLRVALAGARDPFLRAQRLTVELAPLRLTPEFHARVARVRLTGAALTVARDREGNLNIARLWAGSGATPGREHPAVPPSGAPAPPPVALGRIELAGGRVEFTDATVNPPFTTTLADLQADVRQTAGNADRMDVRVSGVLGDSGSLELQGWVTPFAQPLRINLDGAIRDYELAQLNPYAVRYVRYRFERGRITTEVQYRYDGGRFNADSAITIRHIQLGEELGDEFGERVGIPLELAVSLLEDRRGEIRLQIPVSGDAEGRHFEIGSVIWTAVRQTVVKVLAAPFRLFGSVLTLGGKIGEVRITPIGFLPGSLEPDEDATKRFAELIEFLTDKPKLSLELRGVATRQELEPLKRERLREALKKELDVAQGPIVKLYHDAGGGGTDTLPSTQEMEAYVLERMKLTDEDLRELADARARTIQDTLVRRGVRKGQLFIATGGDRVVAQGEAGRVEFEILR